MPEGSLCPCDPRHAGFRDFEERLSSPKDESPAAVVQIELLPRRCSHGDSRAPNLRSWLPFPASGFSNCSAVHIRLCCR